MQHSSTTTRTSTVTATETRVRAVMRQVRTDLLAACTAGLAEHESINEWYDDLTYMLRKNALEHFELRACRGEKVVAAWRYVIADDGSITLSERGGGTDFHELRSSAEKVHIVITRRQGLSAAVTEEIDRRGWTVSVKALSGALKEERSYSKDGYGVVRHRVELR